PEPAPIYGAAKLVGTVGGRTTVGLLSAVTGRPDAEVQLGDGTRARRAADVVTTYNVLRAKRLLGADAEVGVLATAANRFERAVPVGGLCPTTLVAPAADGRCLSDAYVASVDGRWRTPDGNYAAAGQAVASLLAGGPARAEPDGIPIQPGSV